MEFKEFTGKTVADALTNATVSLGITSDQVKYEVLEEGSNGFLGIGSKDAVIKDSLITYKFMCFNGEPKIMYITVFITKITICFI